MPKELRNSLIALFITFILVIICYVWIDRPVVYWAYGLNLRDSKILLFLAHFPEIFTLLACLLFPYLAIRFSYNFWGDTEKLIFAFLTSLVITEFVHTPLKIVFGRYWPVTWVNNNPSLINNHVYGFTWFHFGTDYASFPSGHTAATTAVMGMVWFLYPRWRWLCILVSVLIAMGLIGTYYHFVSDVIGGGVLGGLVAYFVSKIYLYNSNIKAYNSQ